MVRTTQAAALPSVIPAQAAGAFQRRMPLIHLAPMQKRTWIPACAGMTPRERRGSRAIHNIGHPAGLLASAKGAPAGITVLIVLRRHDTQLPARSTLPSPSFPRKRESILISNRNTHWMTGIRP